MDRADDRPIIAHVLPTLDGGGTERALVALLGGLDATLRRHVVITLRAPGRRAATLPDAVACHPLHCRQRDRWAGLRLARALRDCGAHVVHARNTGCWLDALLAAAWRTLTGRPVRVVLGFHGFDEGDRFTPRQVSRARLGHRLGARFATVSHRGADQLQTEAGIPAGRISVLPNGVDWARFADRAPDERRRLRNEWRLADESVAVGIIGSLTPVKGHACLLDAFAEAQRSQPDLRLVIVGDGPLRGALQQRAQQLGVRDAVRFVGPREDVPACLAAVDVCVCASWSEGLSNVLLEAMAAGRAVVTTDVGDHALVARPDRESIVVPAGACEGLARALACLSRDTQLRRALGEAARARAAEYDFAAMVERYERFYAGLLNAAPAVRPVSGMAAERSSPSNWQPITS